jgi:hypothetical protein
MQKTSPSTVYERCVHQDYLLSANMLRKHIIADSDRGAISVVQLGISPEQMPVKPKLFAVVTALADVWPSS